MAPEGSTQTAPPDTPSQTATADPQQPAGAADIAASVAAAQSGQVPAKAEPEQPPAPKPRIEIGDRGIELRTFDDLVRFAGVVAKSEMCPKDMRGKPETVFVAVQFGLELGLSPMSALQNIAVVNGRPAVWGDAVPAIVRARGALGTVDEWYEVDGQRIPGTPQGEWTDETVAVCAVRRKGEAKLRIGMFSVRDAKTAKLWGKDSPWTFYPARMLMWRARGFAYRDAFPDILKGAYFAEEVQDLEPDEDPNRIELPTLADALQQAGNVITNTEPTEPAGRVESPDEPHGRQSAATAGPGKQPELGLGISAEADAEKVLRDALIPLAKKVKYFKQDATGRACLSCHTVEIAAELKVKRGTLLPFEDLGLAVMEKALFYLEAIERTGADA